MCVKLAIFFILMCSGYCEEIYRCTNNNDCKSDKQRSIERCSICADSTDGEAKCLFPFPYMFRTDDLTCDKLDLCPDNCPTDRGRCSIETYVYVPDCACKEGFFGYQCENKVKSFQKPIHYVSWRFRGLISVSFATELKFAFGSRFDRDYKDIELVLNTSDGFFVKRSGWNEVPGNCVYRSPNCTALVLEVKFPYKLFSHTDHTQFITLKDKVVGYYANFSVMAIDLGKIIYKREFQIIVSYESDILRCVASINLENCATSSEKPTIINRPTGIDFESELYYVTDGKYISTSVANENCSDGNKFTWKLWSFQGDEEKLPSLFENYNSHTWRFDPYFLDIGMYKLLFEVHHVKTLARNFVYCYLKVKALPLIVKVEGGSDRLIDKNYGLTLSAARSSDPNMPTSKQQDLRVEWSCKRISPQTNIDHMCLPKSMNATTPYFISPDLLTYSAVYNFTLKVWSNLYMTTCVNCEVKPKITFIRIQVLNETSHRSISIQCMENCDDKVIVNEPLFLKVTSDNMDVSEITEFDWTYSNASLIGESLNTMKVEGVPSFMLLLREGSLESGTEYIVTVAHHSEGVYAKYTFETDILLYDEVCKVEPLNGIRGLTEFDITCPLKDDYTLIYEFYDKSNEDMTSNLSFNGRMLGTTSTGELHNVRLTRGHVDIYIINSQGVSIRQEIIVQLSDWNVTAETITEIRKNLTDHLIYFGDEFVVARRSSLITDILPSKEENDFKFLLSILSKISPDTFQRMKLLTSALYIVLRDFNTPNQLELQTDILINALDFMDRLTNELRQSVFNRRSSQYTPSKVIKEIAEILLQCFSVVIKCKTNKSVDIDELPLRDRTMLKHGSNLVQNTINSLKDVLTFIQYSGKPPLQISTQNADMMIWAITNDRNYPISRYLNNNYSIPVSIPPALINSLTNKTYKRVDLSLQTAYIGDGHFMWFKSDIKSNLVSVSLATRKGDTDLSYINSFHQPLTIHMVMNDNLMNIKLEGSVTQADPSLNQDYLDTQVKIHRLDISPRSRMTIIFLYPPTNGSLRVSVMEEFRPDFDHMIKHSKIISKDSYEYPHHYHEYDEARFLYMGIIPGKEVSINQSVNYIIEVNTTLCQYWLISSWKSDGCLVGHDSKGKNISCQCTHLSTFGSAFLVPPQQVDPFGDAKLFLSVFDNPLVVALVVTFLILYLLLCIYLWHMDKTDDLRKNVIVLEDNFPFDEFPYLLAVFTSPRLNAGTTANIGIRLVGNEAESRAHILTSNHRKVLRTGSDDWFLINCPSHLGKILYLHLWHDNAGWSPSWFCENIFVYDLTKHTETKFVVEQWLALSSLEEENDRCYPEARVLPSEDEDISSIKRKFLDNVVLGIRDGHKLMRVLYRHPRSQVTRVERLSIIMLYIMVSMLCSIMFYKPEDENTVGVDDYQYSIEMKEFIISIQCLILSATLSCIVLFLFKKSYKFKPHIRGNITGHGRGNNTLYSNVVRYITSIMKNPPLNPVQLPNTPQVTGKRKIWYISAWVSCITTILICAYLVMLYGLKLGPVKSKKWLSSVLLAVGEDFLMAGPAKIILFAIGLSLVFQLMVEVNTYHISINDLVYHRNIRENADVGKILKKREQRMYAPLSKKTRDRIQQEKQIKLEWWKVLAFIVALAFVFVTCNVIFILWSSHYYSNNHIENMIVNTKYPLLHSITFYNVSNVTTLEHYLGNTFINVIYNSRWYDRQLVDEKRFLEYNYWTSDFANKLVGLPKIRQLRTIYVSCENVVIKNGLCIPEWKESTEDTNIYSKRWEPGSYFDVNKIDSFWVYREKSSIIRPTLVRFYGRSGRLFHDGGYSAILGPTRLEAEQTLDEMQADKWQNEKTRVVFVEFTTFNGNNLLFSQVTLVVEYLVSGTVLLQARVSSVSSIFDFNLWNILFVVFIVAYILRTIYLISYFGLLEYLLNGIDNVFQIITIVIGISSIMLFCAHFYTASQYINELQDLEFDQYFEYDSFVQYFVLLKISLSFLLCVSIIRVIGSIRGKSVMNYTYMFISSLSFIYWLTVLSFLAFFVLKWWSLLLDITSFNLKELLVNSKLLKCVPTRHVKNTYMKVFILLKMFTIYIINTVFLVVLVHNTRLSKSYMFSASQRFNFIEFILSRIISWWNKIISRKT